MTCSPGTCSCTQKEHSQTATVPQFPDSREITLDDKPIFDTLFAKLQPRISTYTFTNLFAWRNAYNTRISSLCDSIVVHYNSGNRRSCLQPLCREPHNVIREIFDRSTSEVTEVICVNKRQSDILEENDGLIVEYDRNNSDYVYLASDLAELPGRKFDAKRNFINKINANYQWTYEVLDARHAKETEEFTEYWCSERSCEKNMGLLRERTAVQEMLDNFEELGIKGGAIRMDGNIVAICLAEPLNHDTMVIHVEKADPKIDGLYQLINNEFVKHEADGFKYINREQDLGISGLRKAKKSYQPIHLEETYTVRRSE